MAGTMKIGTHEIGDSTQCYVIAEIGHNHQGSLDRARELFKEAKLAGAHAVKLQKRHNRGLYTRAAYNKPYDNENSFGATYGEHREFLEFEREEYTALQAYAKELGVDFFATAFDLQSADFLQSLDVPAFKIASGDLKTIPLLQHVARLGKPMFVSTGGATLEDVRRMETTLPKPTLLTPSREHRHEIWDAPILWVSLFVILCLEWILRKRARLI